MQYGRSETFGLTKAGFLSMKSSNLGLPADALQFLAQRITWGPFETWQVCTEYGARTTEYDALVLVLLCTEYVVRSTELIPNSPTPLFSDFFRFTGINKKAL